MKSKENSKYVYESKKNINSSFFKMNNVCKPQKQNKRHEKNDINQEWVYYTHLRFAEKRVRKVD